MRWPWAKRQRLESDLDREIRAHLDLEAEEQQEKGLDATESAYAARRAFGNQTILKEQTREMRTYLWIELFQDV